MHDATPDFFFFGASAALFLIPLKLRRFGITATRFAPRRSHSLSCASSARILFASTRIAAISSRDSFGTPSRTHIRWQRQPALPRRNPRINLMPLPMHLANRCTARSKRSGKPCRSPAVGCHRVCRMHGQVAVHLGAIAMHGSTAAIHARASHCADTSQKWCE